MRQNILLLITLIILAGCGTAITSSADKNSANNGSTTKEPDSITIIGITIFSSGNTIIDEVNLARKAIALGGESAKRYYDEIIVSNVMSNSDMPTRLEEIRKIYYGESDVNSSISQSDLRTLPQIIEDSLITKDIDNYTVDHHDTKLWKQGENSEIAWFSDLSKYSVTANMRARAVVAGWLADSGNAPTFGHRVAILNPKYVSGGATSDVTNSMEGKKNLKSGGHVVARFRMR